MVQIVRRGTHASEGRGGYKDYLPGIKLHQWDHPEISRVPP
jgi:hypothetical protein